MKLLLFCFILSSCSLLNKKIQFNKNQELLQSIEINQSSNDSVVFVSKQILKDNISDKKFSIIKKELNIYKYNSLILSKAKDSPNSKRLNKTYSNITNSPLFYKIEKLKLKKIDKDYNSYLKTFYKNKKNKKRLNIIRSIIDIDFPSMHYIDLIAQTTALATKYDNLYDQINYYAAVKNFLTSSLYNVNVYLYKDIPTKLLSKLLNEVNTKAYKETRRFIEDIQIEIHNDLINSIITELKRKSLIHGDLITIKKGAS